MWNYGWSEIGWIEILISVHYGPFLATKAHITAHQLTAPVHPQYRPCPFLLDLLMAVCSASFYFSSVLVVFREEWLLIGPYEDGA